jgi:hypothetical protein
MNDLRSSLRRPRNTALAAAGVGAVLAAVGWLASPVPFYRAYLHAWLLWLGVSLGAMALTLVIHLLGGGWGACLRRLAEAAAMVLPLMALLFVPIAFGAASLFPWAHGLDWQADPVLAHRHPYENLHDFLARAAVYAVVWIGTAMALWWGGRRGGSLAGFAGPALALYVLTMGLFASTDWVLGLEPHYKSTVFGLVLVAGQGVSALCVLIGTLALLSRTVMDAGVASADDWNDLGTVLLTATMLYCYLVVCQFVINWMGNTQDDARWYLQRTSNGWHALSWLLVVFHLVLPLLLLMWRRVKRRPAALLAVCAMLLVTRAVDGFWTVNASGEDPTPLLGSRVSWLDVVLPVTIGCAWMAMFVWLLGRRPLAVERAIVPAGVTHAA